MSGDVLTSWGLVFQWERSAAGETAGTITLADLFDHAQRAYLARCTVLAAFLDEAAGEVRAASGPAGARASGSLAVVEADGALVGVSVVEIRPSSFDMAVRIRPAGDGDPASVNLRRTLVVSRIDTSEPLAIPRDVRGELIALQLTARDLC